jgi:hypothetical protein
MIISSYDHSFIVQASVITIVNYDHTVIMTVNYDNKTFIVQATGHNSIKNYVYQLQILVIS